MSKFIFSLPVHQCDEPDHAGCAHICTKKGDDAVCGCYANFILARDGKECDPSKFILL